MTLSIKQVDIDKIIVGKRFREDVGDISELSSGIKEKGFIGAIVVDENLNLAAGQRRLEAAKAAGMHSIAVTNSYQSSRTEKNPLYDHCQC